MFILLCNPENRRARLFESAVRSSGYQCKIFAYEDVLSNEIFLDELFSLQGILKIESPGENLTVRKLFTQRACEQNLDATQLANDFSFSDSEICFQRLWYKGFSHLLNEIDNRLKASTSIVAINQPSAIRLLFNKWECQNHLLSNDISVPELLGRIQNFEDLEDKMKDKTNRVFIKPFHASSASGVLAYRRQVGRHQLITSVEMDRSDQALRLFNSLKIRTYTERGVIEELINCLSKENLYAEKWIPKVSSTEGVYDLRVMVIGGEARHVVARTGKSPITNLHLGNSRGNLPTIKSELGDQIWKRVLSIAEEAVSWIPGLFYAGVDVMITNNKSKVYVLELNAFGDLIPNLTDRGESTYEAIVNQAITLI